MDNKLVNNLGKSIKDSLNEMDDLDVKIEKQPAGEKGKEEKVAGGKKKKGSKVKEEIIEESHQGSEEKVPTVESESAPQIEPESVTETELAEEQELEKYNAKKVKRSFMLSNKQFKMVLELRLLYLDKDNTEIAAAAIEEYYEKEMRARGRKGEFTKWDKEESK